MDRFVARMRAEAAASADGASVWVLRNARFAVFCILLDMTFGLLDLDEEHIVHIDAVLKRVLLAVGVRMDDYLPFLRPFFWRKQLRALAVRREQARLHEEIMQQVGDARPIDDKDIESMPYLQAFVKELLRKHPPTYFSLTHAAVKPGSKLAGYDVPTDANLDIFLPTISEDPKLWDRPTEFDPDRFLTGGETADMTGSAGIRMIPFGAGRRICPGLAMGTTHIALMVARMLQEFEWRAHPSQPAVDFKDKVEFTVVMNQPLLATVKPRKMSL
uniref:Cytochrome P450 77A2 n=1 Tax=Aegilops tauschii TaxID=37682 RepID=M8BR18_AEGTA